MATPGDRFEILRELVQRGQAAQKAVDLLIGRVTELGKARQQARESGQCCCGAFEVDGQVLHSDHCKGAQ